MYGVLAGFILGLAGSLHCAGMCGPLLITSHELRASKGLQLPVVQSPRRIRNSLLYQVGRITTYTMLGIVVGLGGSAIRLAGYSRMLSMVAGVLMLGAVALQVAFRKDWSPLSIFGQCVTWLQRTIANLLTKESGVAQYSLGLANGLLPCGLVTTALIGSLASGSLPASAGYMAAFGLGTVPLMSAIALGITVIPPSWRRRLPLAAPIAGLMVGALVLVRGMGLGIPYVSPAPPTPTHTCCSR